ncbi:MAG: hypothetical protein JRM80_03825 [Nitrososphaerota archaeon]|nr:hypothetical protein [Nitrososphaerota archaeon]
MQSAESEWDPKEAVELGDELLKYADTLQLERGTKERIAEFMREFQKAFSKPVKLNPKHLSEWFPGADSALLLEGESLVMKRGSKEVKVSVLEMEPAPYMALVQEVAAEVARLMEEEDVRRAKSVVPSLQAFVKSSREYASPADWHGSELIFTNTGGLAAHVMVFSPASKEWYGPFDIKAMETAEVGMQHFSRLRDAKPLKITIRCDDQDGRNYAGEVELTLGSKAVRVIKLIPADEAPARE